MKGSRQMINDKGLFIVLEGGEGSGKSTLVEYLEELFVSRGQEVVTFREPGGTNFAENIRNLYLSTEGLHGETVSMLMNSARTDNIEKIILPALNAGKVVIADRFSPSTLVYQGIRQGLYEEVEKVTKHIPMISIFVDVPPEVGIERIKKNNRATNRLDLLPMETHQVIYEGYHSLSERIPEIYWDIILDGTLSLDELYSYLDSNIVDVLSDLLDKGYSTETIKKKYREYANNKIKALS